MDQRIVIARKVRKAVEYLLEEGILEQCEDGLGGLCAITSAALVRAFKKNGYYAVVVYGQYADNDSACHCWVLSEGLNWDLTATQFDENLPDVYHFESDKNYRLDEYVRTLTYFEDWPKEQRPTYSTTRLILMAAGL